MLVSKSVRNSSVRPTNTALRMLVVMTPTASRTRENRILPRLPIRAAVSAAQVQPHRLQDCCIDPENSRIPRETTPIPKATHRNAVVTVMVPVIWRNAAIMPMIRLAIPESSAQEHLQLHIVIVSPPMTIYAVETAKLPVWYRQTEFWDIDRWLILWYSIIDS